MRFTIAERTDGRHVGKVARVKDGAIELDGTNPQHPDRFEIRDLTTPRELAELVNELGPSRLLVAGVPKSGAQLGSIGTKNNLTADSIALSDDSFEWPAGPGLWLLDHDPKKPEEGGKPALNLGMDDFIDAVEDVVPELMQTWARWPSSSSCISGEGVEPRGIRGFHYGVVVADARDIPRAGGVLFKRLILAGKGYGFVTKTGRVIPRTIVDGAVWRPTQKIFAGGVEVKDGLKQDRHDSIELVESTTPVDTVALLPDLTTAEEAAYEAECDRLKREAEAVSASRRAEYLRSCTESRAPAIMEKLGVRLEEAKRLAAEQITREQASVRFGTAGTTAHLGGHAEILTEDGLVTVDEILAEPAKWHRQACADPVEHDYNGGVGVAHLFTDGRPNIYSHAHGGCTYFLRESADATFGDLDVDAGSPAAEVACAATVIEKLRRMSRDAMLASWLRETLALSKSDAQEVLEEVSRLTARGIRALAVDLADARSKLAAAQAQVERARRAGRRKTIANRVEDQTDVAEELEREIAAAAAPGEFVAFGGVLAEVVTAASLHPPDRR